MPTKLTTLGPSVPSPAFTGMSVVPLFHAAWLFAAGIFLAHAAWLRPTFLLVALAPVAVLCCVAAITAQRIAWVPVAVMWCLLGAWCAEMEPHPSPAPMVTALSDGLLRTVEGTVMDTGPLRGEAVRTVDEPGSDGPSQRVDLRISRIEVVSDTEDTLAPTPGGVRLTVRWPEKTQGQPSPQPFQCGERVRAVVRLLPPEVYRDPGVWRGMDYLLDQGITSTASVKTERIERLGGAQGLFLACRIGELQHATSARLLALPSAMRSLPA